MRKTDYIIGIDEVGRGPLAGPTCVCACIVPKQHRSKVARKLAGIRDSKKLTMQSREDWYEKIKELQKLGLLDFAYSFISAGKIDEIGIVPAIKLAMKRSLKKLEICNPPDCQILLDGGLYAPEEYTNQKTIIGGDNKEWIISTASIIAKVERDWKMCRLAKKYPQYEFEKHKGYGTRKHREMIKLHGFCKEHRRSFCKKHK